MLWLRELFGELLDTLMGPSITRIHDGETKNATYKLSPTVNDPSIEIGVRSTQIIFETRYKRFWIPNRKRTVYEVVGFAPPEHQHLLDARLLEVITYPMLCHPLLRWTAYPHVYAIDAYVDRVHIPSVKVSI